MRRLLVVLALAFVAPASAATIHGLKHGGLLLGTPASDTLVGGPGNDFIQAAWGGTDRVDCGGGFNVVAADLGDHVASNCQVVSRRLSVDTSTNPQSQHETAVEPADAAWGTTVVATYQLGRFAGGGASNIGFAVSNDSGRTWKRGVLPGVTGESSPPGPESAASDPTVAYDAAHAVWLIGTLTLEHGGSRVMVAHSSDGLHWSLPVTAASGPELDKDWLTCDNGTASPFADAVTRNTPTTTRTSPSASRATTAGSPGRRPCGRRACSSARSPQCSRTGRSSRSPARTPAKTR